MYACMRTTLVLDDPIFEKAKKRSAELGVTLSQLTTTALRSFLFSQGEHRTSKPRFVMPTIGSNLDPIHQTSDELAKLRDEGR
jgi:hypothetical protein